MYRRVCIEFGVKIAKERDLEADENKALLEGQFLAEFLQRRHFESS